MLMKKQQHVAGVRCMCVLVCKRDRDEVKNQSANEQSQIPVFRITIVINLGVSQNT